MTRGDNERQPLTNQVIPEAAPTTRNETCAMSVTEKMVEAVAKAAWEAQGDRIWWATLDDERQNIWRYAARAALEAAAPHMHRTAWNEGFTAARAMQDFRDTL